MINTSRHKIELTNKKKEVLDYIYDETRRVVNIFIGLLWGKKVCPKYIDKKIYKQVDDSWFTARMLQNAGKQAIDIIKSQWKQNSNNTFNTYRKVYARASARGKTFPFMDKPYGQLDKSEWRMRVSKPEFDGNISLNANCIDIQESGNSFDIWVKLSSIGEKIKLLLPTRHHKHSNTFSDWKQLKSGMLSRAEDGNWYLNIFWKMEIENKPESKDKEKNLGIDLGINKLLSLSDEQQYGDRFKGLIDKLRGKKQNSKKYKKLVKQIHNYIGEIVNEIDLTGINSVILEDLTNIQKNTKKGNKDDTSKKTKRLGKKTRYYLSRWNKTLVQDRIKQRCAKNRINCHDVNPEYTSQTCNSCGKICKSARNGESYKCECGHTANADINAGKNIRDKFLGCGVYSPAQQENNQLNNLLFNS